MKKLIAIAIAATFLLGVGISSAIAVDAPAAAAKVGNFGKKAPVSFDHSTHAGSACVDCHHNEADGKYKCTECHTDDASAAPTMKDAAHKKEVGVCWTCHNKKSPTVVKAMKCKECHVK